MKQESVTHSKEINQQILKKDLMAELLDKDFKTAVFRMLRELKDDIEKLKKTMCEQTETITKEGKPKSN